MHTQYFEAVLGTSLEIQIASSEQASGPVAESAALAEIDRLEAIFNAYDPSSELSQWQSTFESAVQVSPELALILGEAERWRLETSGAFNPTVEALTRLWDSGAEANRPVTPAEIKLLLPQLQGPLWKIDLEKGTAQRLTMLRATLNSIAKGFIIDRAALVASESENVEQVLLNIGGDIRHIGSKGVEVNIADPGSDAENAAPVCRITLKNQGIATSGNYRRGFRIGKQWFSHIIDPRSGFPVKELVGVSVIAPDALTADVLATAFSVLKPKESLALANSQDQIGVFLIESNGKTRSNSFWDAQRI